MTLLVEEGRKAGGPAAGLVLRSFSSAIPSAAFGSCCSCCSLDHPRLCLASTLPEPASWSFGGRLLRPFLVLHHIQNLVSSLYCSRASRAQRKRSKTAASTSRFPSASSISNAGCPVLIFRTESSTSDLFLNFCLFLLYNGG